MTCFVHGNALTLSQRQRRLAAGARPAHELLLECHKKAGNQKGVEREERLIPIVREWNKKYQKSTLLEGAPEP